MPTTEPTSLAQEFLEQFPDRILTVDSHTAGEPTRLVVGGLPAIPGETINDKRLYTSEHLDHVRLLLAQEPRGHRDTLAAIITAPATEGAAFGIVFMDACRYPYMCGHGTIGAVTTLLEMGWLSADEPETVVVVDSPSGPVHTRATVRKEPSASGRSRVRVESVAIQMESAFAFLLDQPLEVPGLGRLIVDVSFAGGFFVMVSAEQVGLALTPENGPELARWGMAIIEAGNQQLQVQHPTRTYINTIDVTEFYDPAAHTQGRGKNAVIYGESHIDRSPCGTGTSAKMALMYRRGELALDQPFTNEGILGTTFEGRVVAATTVEGLPAIVPEVRGSAYITGVNQFVLDPRDPFPQGFLV
jgi:proline racemase/trans-L-3-hydroxyproline dehydratase